jgi:hypothetical protein
VMQATQEMMCLDMENGILMSTWDQKGNTASRSIAANNKSGFLSDFRLNL